MKKVVSISLGSSSRDHKVVVEMLGEKISIERCGTDGDMDKAIKMFRMLDGKVDAFGMGGIDLYLYAGDKRYVLRDAEKITRAVTKTPLVDGSGLKNTLERKVINYLNEKEGFNFRGRKVLMVCAVDRFGMAQALVSAGANMVFGDLIFGLGVPVAIYSIQTLERIARILIPVLSKLPFKLLYPTGEKQEKVDPRYEKYYNEAEIIAGDFHFIRRYMPPKMNGKTIITNTVTANDIELLKERGVMTLITTTPELEGRSFGTNVMEGVLVSIAGKDPSLLRPSDYDDLLDKMGFKPRIVHFN